MALLELDSVTKRFGGLLAVSNVSFSLDRGEILSMIGPNGAGKTTAFNCITGLFPDHLRRDPTSTACRSRGVPPPHHQARHRPDVPEHPPVRIS